MSGTTSDITENFDGAATIQPANVLRHSTLERFPNQKSRCLVEIQISTGYIMSDISAMYKSRFHEQNNVRHFDGAATIQPMYFAMEQFPNQKSGFF